MLIIENYGKELKSCMGFLLRADQISKNWRPILPCYIYGLSHSVRWNLINWSSSGLEILYEPLLITLTIMYLDIISCNSSKMFWYHSFWSLKCNFSNLFFLKITVENMVITKHPKGHWSSYIRRLYCGAVLPDLMINCLGTFRKYFCPPTVPNMTLKVTSKILS